MALWQTGIYEARMLAAFVADPSALTVAEMNAWARDFDSWAVCDNACFHLFDKSSHAVGRVKAWAHVEDEFVRRAAFALLASLALHKNKAKASDDELKDLMPVVEVYAHDDRNFVKKALSWALRSCQRRPGLVDDARAIAATLSARSDRGLASSPASSRAPIALGADAETPIRRAKAAIRASARAASAARAAAAPSSSALATSRCSGAPTPAWTAWPCR